jgi:hypothetical protein
MRKSREKSLILILVISGILLFALAGCNGNPTDAPVVTGEPATVEPTTADPTSIPAKLVLVDTQGQADETLTTLLTEFASANSLLFETRSTQEGDFAGVVMAVVLDATDSLNSTASSNPETQFVGVGSAISAPAANLSIIRNKPEDLAFMAGQLTTLVSEDWRSGGLLNANGAAIEVISDAFVNGGNYVCGWCKPTYPPYLSYPVYQDISGKAGAEMAADVEVLSTNFVDVAFVSRAADVTEVIEALQTAEIAMIGENANSAEAGRYAAILGFDAGTALEEMLPKLLAGQGRQEAVSRVVLVVVNDETLITPGRQELFNTAAEALQGGWIIPLSVQ